MMLDAADPALDMALEVVGDPLDSGHPGDKARARIEAIGSGASASTPTTGTTRADGRRLSDGETPR